jgi:O-antigen/teichoic acid export membrane protein
LDSRLSRFRSQFRLSTVSSLQIFQLTRYSGFVLTGLCFARLGIAKSEIGRFETFLWLMGLFSFFWIAGLMNSMLASYPRQTNEGKKQLLFTTFCLILMISAVAGVVQCIAGRPVLGLAYLLLNNASYMVEYILFLQDHRRRLIAYGIAMAVVQFLLCVVPAYFYHDTHYALYGLIVAAGIKFIYILYLLRRHTLTEFQFSRVRALFLLALPLMLSFFVNGSAEYIDGAVVKHYFSLADFSVFRYGSRDFPLFTILAATLSMSMIPRVAENLNAGIHNIKSESQRYMHFFFPLAIVLILSGRWLFTVFFTAQFTESGRVFAALMLLTVPRVLFPQTILTALRENKLILAVAIMEMLINIIASILLAQRFGLVGVAYGTVVAFTAEKILMAAILYYKHGILPSRYIAYAPFSIYTLLVVLSYLVSLRF